MNYNPLANNHTNESFEQFALLLEYPGREIRNQFIRAIQHIISDNPDTTDYLNTFAGVFGNLPHHQQEEIYIRTFDVQAFTTMDVGYILFGEDYKRGKLLVHLNREHRMAGVDCKGQLADYLPNMLRLLSRMEDEAIKAELIQRIVIPAVRKIQQDFHPDKLQKKKILYKKHQKTLLEDHDRASLVYSSVFEALAIFLNGLFVDAEFQHKNIEHAYTKDLQQEMKIQP